MVCVPAVLPGSTEYVHRHSPGTWKILPSPQIVPAGDTRNSGDRHRRGLLVDGEDGLQEPFLPCAHGIRSREEDGAALHYHGLGISCDKLETYGEMDHRIEMGIPWFGRSLVEHAVRPGPNRIAEHGRSNVVALLRNA